MKKVSACQTSQNQDDINPTELTPPGGGRTQH
jgi:hypothetical protein